MLEELNIMKLNFEVKHRFDFSGTLSTSVVSTIEPRATTDKNILSVKWRVFWFRVEDIDLSINIAFKNIYWYTDIIHFIEL